jgi:hypothetical protein
MVAQLLSVSANAADQIIRLDHPRRQQSSGLQNEA